MAFKVHERVYAGPDAMQILEDCIRNPPINSRVFEFTPEMAEAILLIHKPEYQRRLKAKLPRFAQAMLDDAWGLTGDTIKFGASGDLLDGQNRLTACVRSGKNFTSHVVFGIDDEAFALLDQGNIRSKEDVFRSAGVPHPNVTAKAVSWAEKIERNTPGDRSTPEPYALLKLYHEKYEGKIDHYVTWAIEAAPALAYPAGELAALFYHVSLVGEDRFPEFFDGIVKGSGPASKAVDALRTKLANQKSEGFRIRDTQYAAWFMEAWNAFMAKGEKVSPRSMFRWSVQDEHYPELKAA